MTPTNREPTSPGEMLREEFLVPLGLTQAAFAAHIGVTTESINRIVNGKRNITPEMALRLSAGLGTTPDFWLNLQRVQDLWHAQRKLKAELKKVKPITAKAS